MLNTLRRTVLRVSLLIRLAQVAFFVALVFTFYSAVIPPAQAIQLAPWDKAEHFIAFYCLTGLAVAAFPRGRLLVIAVLLSVFGALIEFVQGLSVAIASALAPMLLVWWRRLVASGQKNIDI